MQKPTLLLVGEDSLLLELENAETVAGMLPHAGVVVLLGLWHLAMYTTPDLFVRAVVLFLEE